MSAAEDALAWQLTAVGIPFTREVQFARPRRWRSDFEVECFGTQRLLVEVDGGAFVNGRHTSGAGFEADCEKLNEAAVRGYRVLRVTPRHVEDGRALKWIEAAR